MFFLSYYIFLQVMHTYLETNTEKIKKFIFKIINITKIVGNNDIPCMHIL